MIQKILKSGDYLGFDSKSIRKGSYKPYLSSYFAKTKTQSIVYTMSIKTLAAIFGNSD